jgi:hypothetical protein
VETWVAGAGSGAKISSLDVTEGPDDSVRLVVEFRTPRYAKSMRGALLLVGTSVLPVRDRIALPDTTRKYPVQLNSRFFEETLRI